MFWRLGLQHIFLRDTTQSVTVNNNKVASELPLKRDFFRVRCMTYYWLLSGCQDLCKRKNCSLSQSLMTIKVGKCQKGCSEIFHFSFWATVDMHSSHPKLGMGTGFVLANEVCKAGFLGGSLQEQYAIAMLLSLRQ